ncbi:hypothetical protein HYDPIDRAFT_112479 [Hydnomerulius pinastri MD-312]|uniref:Unplaced genomic scaffold scaffold_14, whole genome shotgun sequence n=1 Tax=Hydnomerulius pinastri MD-312 TaxID=994086 RepID=A0A0C9WF76_9AGAM|nr:hypothetical protein HYDPIDRAFT_112479 [Hydnomerulius pinastri MD-312]
MLLPSTTSNAAPIAAATKSIGATSILNVTPPSTESTSHVGVPTVNTPVPELTSTPVVMLSGDSAVKTPLLVSCQRHGVRTYTVHPTPQIQPLYYSSRQHAPPTSPSPDQGAHRAQCSLACTQTHTEMTPYLAPRLDPAPNTLDVRFRRHECPCRR